MFVLCFFHLVFISSVLPFFQLINRFQLLSSGNCFPKVPDTVIIGQKWPFRKGCRWFQLFYIDFYAFISPFRYMSCSYFVFKPVQLNWKKKICIHTNIPVMENKHTNTSRKKKKMIQFWKMSKLNINRIGGVMVSVLASCVVDRGFEPWTDLTRIYKICICCFSAKYATLRKKSKDWLARNRDNVTEWVDMSIRGLLIQWASTIKIHWSSTKWSHHHLIEN